MTLCHKVYTHRFAVSIFNFSFFSVISMTRLLVVILHTTIIFISFSMSSFHLSFPWAFGGSRAMLPLLFMLTVLFLMLLRRTHRQTTTTLCSSPYKTVNNNENSRNECSTNMPDTVYMKLVTYENSKILKNNPLSIVIVSYRFALKFVNDMKVLQ